MPATSRPPLRASTPHSDVEQDLVGQQADAGHQRAQVDRRRGGGQGAEERARGEGRAARLAHGPQVVEDEDAVDAEGLGPSGGRQGGVRLVTELREGDADLHRPVTPPDSTRAFRSRRAMDMMRLWARILMKPGSGTFISTSRW